MITLHANILERDGRKAFAVLPYEEFVLVQEELEDFNDLRALRVAKAQEGTAPTISLSEAKRQIRIGVRISRSSRRAKARG